MKGFHIATVLVMASVTLNTALAATEQPPGFDFNQAYFWLSVASSVGQLALWIYVWNAKRNQVSQDKIHALELEIATLKGQVAALPTEKRMDEMARIIGAVERDLTGLTKTVEAQGTALEGIAASARSISAFLLQDKKDEAQQHRGKGR